MQPLRRSLLSLGVALLGVAAFVPAHAADPQEGKQYLALRVPQPTEAGNKVEVIEFFDYACPHCNVFEPLLAGWVRKQGDNIVFKRVHVQRGPVPLPQERLFYTLEAMGLVDRYHAKAFEAMHGGGVRMANDEEVFDWAAKNGIDRAKFIETYRSFGIGAKLRRVTALMDAYDVDRWPLVIVDGRWVTSPSHVAATLPEGTSETLQQQSVLPVMDYLVAKAKATKR